MIERQGRSRWLVVGLLGLILATPAAAEWLVTRDGARIETKGPWKVKGNQVVFTLPNGTLSALRKPDVDLDASASASAGAGAGAQAEEGKDSGGVAAAQGQAPPKQAIAVFNNSNIGRAVPQAPSIEEAVADTPKKSDEPSSEALVEVVSWSERDSAGADGLEIVGTVRNNGTSLAANINVKVTILDEVGETSLETTAFMRSTGLVPGKSTTFRAFLPGIFTLFVEPLFEVSTDGVEVSPAVSTETEEENQNP